VYTSQLWEHCVCNLLCGHSLLWVVWDVRVVLDRQIFAGGHLGFHGWLVTTSLLQLLTKVLWQPPFHLAQILLLLLNSSGRPDGMSVECGCITVSLCPGWWGEAVR
jgi:hypothetical protein